MRSKAVYLFFVTAGIGAMAFWYTTELEPAEPKPIEYPGGLATVDVRIGQAVVQAEVVDTPELQEQGLSGRPSLADGAGMLFVFPDSRMRHFWMPDMRFAIDMIWISSERRVVHVTENATPESYPETFSAPEPVQYVLEVPAGYARAHSVRTGDSASW